MRLWDVVYKLAPDAEDTFEAWCATDGDGIVGQWSPADLEEHVRDGHSTFTWLLEQMIDRTDFTVEGATFSAYGIFARYLLRWSGDAHLSGARAVVNRSRIGSRGIASKVQ